VLFSHASNHGLSISPEISFSGAGRYGVFLFFILSAFLLSKQFIACSLKGSELKLFTKTYIIRRFFRIYPLFTCTLFVYYLLNLIGYPVFNLTEVGVIKHLLLIDGQFILWTIPVEFQYYFILPFVTLILLKIKHVWLLISIVLLFSIFWWLIFPPKNVSYLVPFLPIFILGSGTALLSQFMNQLNIKTIIKYLFNTFALISFVSFFVLTPAFYNQLFLQNVVHTEFHDQFFLFSIISCILVLSVVHGDGMIKKMMETKFFVFWGNISFSAYLGHMIILDNMHFLHAPSIIKLVVFIFLTSLCSYPSLSDYLSRS
jgi:peptidoglycan/LPS O-acetylase OafA/YrhL